MKEEEYLAELDNILDSNRLVAHQFYSYAQKKEGKLVDNLNSEIYQKEFLSKCQWFQHHAKVKLGMENASIEVVAMVVNNQQASSFSKNVSGELYDGYLHFLVASEKDSEFLDYTVNKWIAEGRSVDELDKNELSPLTVSVYNNNFNSFVALYKHGANIEALDKDGFSLLHVITIKIDDGTGKIEFVEKWVEAGLPTDIKSGKSAGANAGQTALEFAKSLGLSDVVKLLGGEQGSDDLSIKFEEYNSITNSDIFNKFMEYAEKGKFILPMHKEQILEKLLDTKITDEEIIVLTQEYGLIELARELGGDVEIATTNADLWLKIAANNLKAAYEKRISNVFSEDNDTTKLLLHYIVENIDVIPIEVIEKLFNDPLLFDNEINCIDGLNPLQRAAKAAIVYDNDLGEYYTPLHYAVKNSHNDYALLLAKKGGFGTRELNNGVNILNFCIVENNMDLLKMIINDPELNPTEFIIPSRIYDDSDLPCTPILQAVKEGKIDFVVELAKAGIGTRVLDNTNHVLEYVLKFGGDNTKKMLEALKVAKIDVTAEKAEQALVSTLHPEIKLEFVKILLEAGIKFDGVLELFTTHGLIQQVDAINNTLAEIELAKQTDSYDDIENLIEESNSLDIAGDVVLTGDNIIDNSDNI